MFGNGIPLLAGEFAVNIVPKLADLLSDPAKVSLVPSEAIPTMLGDLERLSAILWARLSLPQASGNGSAESGDRLLDAKEAAAMLHTSTDYLYRHSSKLPFTVRVGRKVLFSEAGIARYIRARMGR
jgi:predicted DNA-binding transcriptional regulator AlpA